MEISTSYTFGCAIMDRNISLASSLTVVIMDKLLNWEFVKTIKWWGGNQIQERFSTHTHTHTNEPIEDQTGVGSLCFSDA